MSVSSALGEAKEVRLDQGTVRYRERGSGDPIVFVHGLVVNGDLWREVVPRLADDHRCIVPDLPLGAHEVGLEAGADLTPPGLARLIGDFIAALDLQDVTLVANDTGGAFSQILVTENPDRIARLVLTPCDAFDNFLPPLFRYMQVLARTPGFGWQVGQTLRVKAFERLPLVFGRLMKDKLDPEVFESYGRNLRSDRGVRRDLGKVLRGISKRYTLAVAPKLTRFDRPALIVWANEDKVFPVEHAHRLAELLPKARLETIDDSLSFVPEDQPERLAELIDEFVREPVAA